jgi:hypothetical protein
MNKKQEEWPLLGNTDCATHTGEQMTELERHISKANNLLGIELVLIKHEGPAMTFDRQGDLVHDYTSPFSIEWNRPDGITEYLTPRLDAAEVRMFLEGVRFVGTRARGEFVLG